MNPPVYRGGDMPSATNLNWLNEGMGTVLAAVQQERTGGAPGSADGPPPLIPRSALVIRQGETEGETDEESDVYQIKLRHWDTKQEQWAETDTIHFLDCSQLTTAPSVGDKLSVFWDATRAMYVPLSAPAGPSAVTVTGACPCNCIEAGDLDVGGYSTSSRMQVYIREKRVQNANGTLVIPANTWDLYRDTGRGLWVADVGDLALTYYTDGSDATADSTIDLEITFNHSSGGKQRLRIEGTFSIPAPPASSSGSGSGSA